MSRTVCKRRQDRTPNHIMRIVWRRTGNRDRTTLLQTLKQRKRQRPRERDSQTDKVQSGFSLADSVANSAPAKLSLCCTTTLYTANQRVIRSAAAAEPTSAKEWKRERKAERAITAAGQESKAGKERERERELQLSFNWNLIGHKLLLTLWQTATFRCSLLSLETLHFTFLWCCCWNATTTTTTSRQAKCIILFKKENWPKIDKRGESCELVTVQNAIRKRERDSAKPHTVANLLDKILHFFNQEQQPQKHRQLTDWLSECRQVATQPQFQLPPPSPRSS